jgi:hypothetical protein
MSSNAPEKGKEQREALMQLRNRIRTEAVEKLRESGLILVAQASEIKIQVIADRIEWSYIDGKLTYKIDGTDISDVVRGLNVHIRPGDFPKDTLILAQKPVFVQDRADEAE